MSAHQQWSLFFIERWNFTGYCPLWLTKSCSGPIIRLIWAGNFPFWGLIYKMKKPNAERLSFQHCESMTLQFLWSVLLPLKHSPWMIPPTRTAPQFTKCQAAFSHHLGLPGRDLASNRGVDDGPSRLFRRSWSSASWSHLPLSLTAIHIPDASLLAGSHVHQVGTLSTCPMDQSSSPCTHYFRGKGGFGRTLTSLQPL